MTTVWLFVGFAMFVGFLSATGLMLLGRYLFIRKRYTLEGTVVISAYRTMAVCLVMCVAALVFNMVWSVGVIVGAW